jgi:type IV secretory pathway TrbD component
VGALAQRRASVFVASPRLASVAARVAWIALCLLPLSFAVGRFWLAYLAQGEGVLYQYRSIAIYSSDALVAIVCLAWLASQAASLGRVVRRDASVLVVGLGTLALASGLSATHALDPVLALGVAGHLAMLTVFFVASLDLLATFPQRQVVASLGIAVVAQAAFASWQAIAQSTAPAALFNGWNADLGPATPGASVAVLLDSERWLRSYGTFPHPNILGAFLALSVAVLLHTAAGGALRSLAIAAGIAGAALSFSRSSWLAIAVTLGVWLIASRGLQSGARPLWRRVIASPAVVGSILLLVVLAGARSMSLGALPERNSLATRGFYDAIALEIADRGGPVGAGNIVLAQQDLGFPAVLGEPASNVFLITAAELGTPGVIGWLALLAGLAVITWRRRHDPRGRAGPLLAAAVLLPLLLFDHYLWTQPTGRALLVLVLALLVGGSAEAALPTMRTESARGSAA